MTLSGLGSRAALTALTVSFAALSGCGKARSMRECERFAPIIQRPEVGGHRSSNQPPPTSAELREHARLLEEAARGATEERLESTALRNLTSEYAPWARGLAGDYRRLADALERDDLALADDAMDGINRRDRRWQEFHLALREACAFLQTMLTSLRQETSSRDAHSRYPSLRRGQLVRTGSP